MLVASNHVYYPTAGSMITRHGSFGPPCLPSRLKMGRMRWTCEQNHSPPLFVIVEDGDGAVPCQQRVVEKTRMMVVEGDKKKVVQWQRHCEPPLLAHSHSAAGMTLRTRGTVVMVVVGDVNYALYLSCIRSESGQIENNNDDSSENNICRSNVKLLTLNCWCSLSSNNTQHNRIKE